MSAAPLPHTLIAGIGNIFLGDDGFGCEVVRVLGQMPLPPDVRVVDYGIRGLDLAYELLAPYKTILFVDAISRGEAPGTIYLLKPSGETQGDIALDPHSMDPLHLMAMARSLGEVTAEIYIVGCEPLDFGDELEGRMGLSQPVARAVPEGVKAVLDVLSRRVVDAATGCVLSSSRSEVEESASRAAPTPHASLTASTSQGVNP